MDAFLDGSVDSSSSSEVSCWVDAVLHSLSIVVEDRRRLLQVRFKGIEVGKWISSERRNPTIPVQERVRLKSSTVRKLWSTRAWNIIFHCSFLAEREDQDDVERETCRNTSSSSSSSSSLSPLTRTNYIFFRIFDLTFGSWPNHSFDFWSPSFDTQVCVIELTNYWLKRF